MEVGFIEMGFKMLLTLTVRDVPAGNEAVKILVTKITVEEEAVHVTVLLIALKVDEATAVQVPVLINKSLGRVIFKPPPVNSTFFVTMVKE